jgi:D-glycero-alpha-D-manno-heptose-7-phosphate kinase
VSKPFFEKIFLKYSKIEEIDLIDQVNHPIIRETLRELDYDHSGIEISTYADVPSGTGLGSSGSFTTALIKAIKQFQFRTISAPELAGLACKIELDLLKEPIGKQDQYIASLGGIQCMSFKNNGDVLTEDLKISKQSIIELQNSISLFYTGINRSASQILRDQHLRSLASETEILKSLQKTKAIGFEVKKLLEAGKINDFGQILNEHWKIKRKRSKEISSEFIDGIYDKALSNGAIGGKLIGAGGGGFLMFISNEKNRLTNVLEKQGLKKLDVEFEFEGTKVLLSE